MKFGRFKSFLSPQDKQTDGQTDMDRQTGILVIYFSLDGLPPAHADKGAAGVVSGEAGVVEANQEFFLVVAPDSRLHSSSYLTFNFLCRL